MRGKKDCFIYVEAMVVSMANKRRSHSSFYPLIEILFIRRDEISCIAPTIEEK